MPDIFVPLDTTRYTKLYRELSARSYIVNANLHFMDANREQLARKYKKFDTFRTDFQIPEDVIDQMLDEALRKDSLKAKDDKELQKTRADVALIMKALVARDIWDMTEYFQIIYANDPVVKQALTILRKEESD